MPINEKYIEDFEDDTFMHLICKSVSNERLFRNDANRIFFLNKYAQYSSGYFETYSYILLDNHVHWLVKNSTGERLRKYIESIPVTSRKTHQSKFFENKMSYAQAVEFQLKDFFIAYAMAFNKMYKRSGALFLNPFRRIRIKDETHLTQVMIYQHTNVVKHGISHDFENYQWSSYKAILSDKSTLIRREEVLEHFGNKENFINLHREVSDLYYSHPLAME